MIGGISALPTAGSMSDGGMATTAPLVVGGGKKKPVPVAYDMAGEFRSNGKKLLPYDDKSIIDLSKSVGASMGINPSLLASSAWQEGANKAALSPDDISVGYKDHEKELEGYPVDGFFNYGLDTIGDKYDKIKKYLPEGFESKLKFFKTTNEKNQPITTAAFKTNADALTAKAAMLKYEMNNAVDYAKQKGIDLDDKAKNYFMMAAYNGGAGNADKMIDEYIKAKDKNSFIDKGETKLKAIHKNIKTRMDNMAIADELSK